MKLLW